MSRRPFENRVQNDRSSSCNPRNSDPKLRGLGGATKQSKLKTYIKNQKSKQRHQYNKDLKEIFKRCKPTIEQQLIVIEQNDSHSDAKIKKAEKIYR